MGRSVTGVELCQPSRVRTTLYVVSDSLARPECHWATAWSALAYATQSRPLTGAATVPVVTLGVAPFVMGTRPGVGLAG
jgi:hypothetical protein